MEHVRIIRDIIDPHTGNVLVRKGTVGTIRNYFVVPETGDPSKLPNSRILLFEVRIDADPAVTLILQNNQDFRFINGTVGLLKTIFLYDRVVNISQIEGVPDTFYGRYPTHLKFSFRKGLFINFVSDRLIGAIRTDLGIDEKFISKEPDVERVYVVLGDDPSVELVYDHYEWTLNNTGYTSNEKIFINGVMKAEIIDYDIERKNAGTVIKFDVDINIKPTDVLAAVYLQA